MMTETLVGVSPRKAKRTLTPEEVERAAVRELVKAARARGVKLHHAKRPGRRQMGGRASRQPRGPRVRGTGATEKISERFAGMVLERFSSGA